MTVVVEQMKFHPPVHYIITHPFVFSCHLHNYHIIILI